MTQKIKKPVSILLVFMMIVSLFAAVPMTVNAAPPGGNEPGPGGTEIEIGGHALTLYANNGTDQQYTTDKKASGNTAIKEPSDYGFTTPAGKAFRCWNTAADGTGTDYAFGSFYTHSADLTLYAQWGYTVTWKNEDGTTLKTEVLAESTTPTYDGTPEKAEDENYTYTFAGWSPEITAVTGDATYTAQYTATFKGITSNDLYEGLVLDEGTALKFMLMKSGERWKNGYLQVYLDDVLVKDLTVEGGPTTEPDRYYTTTKKCIVDSYEKYSNAHFIHFKSVYDVTWLNENGTELEKDENVVVGTTLTYNGTTPEKAEDANYTYTFSGWTPEITVVTGDAEYTATFTETAKHVHEWDYDNPVWGTPNADWSGGTVSVTVSCKGCDETKTLTANMVGMMEEQGASCGEGGYKKAHFTVTDDGHTLTKEITWDIEPANGEHQFYVEHAAVAPTVDSVGYEAYYECAECGKLFSDEEMTHEISAPVEIPKLKKLFPQHSVSLGGDIGVNFFIDPAAAGADEHAAVSVEFSWNGQSETVTARYDEDEKLFKAVCNVVAAEVACDITAVATVNGETQAQTDTYSVQTYAEAVYNNPTEYDTKGRPDKLQALAKALLNYGAMAQTVFVEYMTQPVKAPADIVKTVEKTDFNAITADDIPGGATDLAAIATELGFKYYTSSVLYLQNNTLRLYFTPNTYQGAMPHEGDFKDNQSNYYYYVEKENIPAAKLDDQQTFTIGGKEFTFSALDYAKAVVNSDMKPDQKNLAKSLYLYNKAANEYFDAAPAPAQKIVDLSTLTADYEAKNGDVLTGKLVNQYKITIADGATVTLKDADITCLSSTTQYDGIALLGDATILLEGENTVKGGHKYNAGIFVPENKTLTIDGTGSLNVSSGGSVAAIGAKRSGMVNGTPGGNIVINGGTINATGGNGGAGIGGCTAANCGTITINGGNITAVGNDNAPGIGSGNILSFCASITINGGTVTATGNKYAAGIGSGQRGECGDIIIAGTVTQVTATKGEDAEASIGAGLQGTCGTITIADGANVTQN